MKKLSVNIIIDILMLVSMALMSFSGFLLNGILPHCHGGGGKVKAVFGMGRHEWEDIHVVVGVILVVLLVLHVVLHWSVVDSYFRKQIPNKPLRWLVYALLLVAMLICVVPWFFVL